MQNNVSENQSPGIPAIALGGLFARLTGKEHASDILWDTPDEGSRLIALQGKDHRWSVLQQDVHQVGGQLLKLPAVPVEANLSKDGAYEMIAAHNDMAYQAAEDTRMDKKALSAGKARPWAVQPAGGQLATP
jgi:hypothetical protein